MTNRELSDRDARLIAESHMRTAIAERDELKAALKAPDDYVIMSKTSYQKYAAAESRAREAEADAARLRRLDKFSDDWWGDRVQQLAEEAKRVGNWDRVACILANGFPSINERPAGTALLAELEAARELIDAINVRDTLESDEVEITVGEAASVYDRVHDAHAKYDAARGAR